MKYRRKGIFKNGLHLSMAFLCISISMFYSGPAYGLQQVRGDTVTFAWDPSEGATGYVVLFAPYPEGDPIERLDVGNRTELTLDVSEGAAYYVGVQAYNEVSMSGLSEILTFVVTADRPLPLKLLDISANGSDSFAGLSSQDAAAVSVQLEPGDLQGQYRDTWIVAETPFGAYSYLDQIGWIEGIHRYSHSPLSPISALGVLHGALPPGKYTFHFAVDENWDDVPDGTWFDSVEVEIRP
jgi:hypothetical protein